MTHHDKQWTALDVRRLRRQLRLSQEAFARLAHVARGTVSEWERGGAVVSPANAGQLDLIAREAGETRPTTAEPSPRDVDLDYVRGRMERLARQLALVLEEANALTAAMRADTPPPEQDPNNDADAETVRRLGAMHARTTHRRR